MFANLRKDTRPRVANRHQIAARHGEKKALPVQRLFDDGLDYSQVKVVGVVMVAASPALVGAVYSAWQVARSPSGIFFG